MAYLNKISLLAGVAALSSLVTQIHAVDEDVEVEAQFRSALGLTVNNDMDFTTGTNVIEFTDTPTGSDLIRLGTDGNISVIGSAFNAPATGQAGDLSIAGGPGLNVEISCTDNATISNGTNTLTVGNLEHAIDTGVGFGSGNDCQGLGANPSVHTLDGTDVILLGGEIDGGTGTVVNSIYNTTNASGVAAQIRVVYQ